jgi:lipopolysaccharide cholinephosphotransferase
MEQLNQGDLRRKQLLILEALAQYCQAHGIRYFLYCGTLLGALRHQGYIPWDDDIDVGMLRPDYERFCQIASDSHQVGGYSLRNLQLDSEFPWPFSKLSDDSTRVVDDLRVPLTIGINIDIFPLDGWPNSAFLTYVHRVRLRVYGLLLSAKIYPGRPSRSRYRKWARSVLQRVINPLSVGSLAGGLSQVASQYSVNESKYFGLTAWAHQERFSNTAFSSFTELSFEGVNYPVPVGYCEVLKAKYGDYMRLPAEQDRKAPHSFEAYDLR